MALDRVIERGYLQLADGNYAGALLTGEKLIAKRHVVGYELKSNALIGLGRDEEGMAAALESVEAHPKAWRAYNLLGMTLNKFERFREALLALRQAQGCEDHDAAELGLNIAMACLGEEDFEGAMAALEGNEDWGEFELPRISMQLGVLVAAERWDDLLRFTDGILDELGEDLLEVYGEMVTGALLGARALGLLHGKDQRRKALNLAWEALRISPDDDMALTAVREAAGKSSPFARLFGVACDVTVTPEEVFACRYAVVADTLAEALDFIVEYEGQLSGGRPVITGHEDGGPATDEYCGILDVFDEDDVDEIDPSNN